MVDKKFRDALNAYWEDGREDADIVVLETPAFDKSVVGLTDDHILIYDFEGMVREFAEDNGCDEIEAVEFIEYNTLRALPYMGERHPIIMGYSKDHLCEMYGESPVDQSEKLD